MRQRFWQTRVVVLSVLLLGLIFAGLAGAVDVLQNGSFENYDTGALVPDHWQVLDGSIAVDASRVYHGSVAIHSPGGTAAKVGDEWVVTPNASQGGTIVQLVDLTTMTGYGSGNWIDVTMSMLTFLWCGSRVDMVLEYLPPSYDGQEVTAGDPVWVGPEVRTAASAYYNSTRTTWRQCSATATIPKVRWARVKLVFDAIWAPDSDFTGGDYYIAVDAVSLLAEVIAVTPSSGNLLLNPGFESVSGRLPDDWHVLSGRMTVIDDLPLLPAYGGAAYAGNVGGTVVDAVDYPDPPLYGSLVQLVDLSTLPNWSGEGFTGFSFSLYYIKNGIQEMGYTVEYLPESYNGGTVTWDDPAWDRDAKIAVANDLAITGGQWRNIMVGPGSLPGVRWMRVRLNIDNSAHSGSSHAGAYLGGFDQVCLQAESFAGVNLIQNAGFEEDDTSSQLAGWNPDSTHGGYDILTDLPVPEGARWLGKSGTGGDHPTVRLYQVIDLANNIPYWHAIDSSGEGMEFRFIQLTLSAWIINHGGTGVKVGLEYLPSSYNGTNSISWDQAAWKPRQWTSNGTGFTNTGGDAIDLGTIFEGVTVDPAWREATFAGWIPRARWLRLRIELDATYSGSGSPLVGIDDLVMTAICRQYGPYSGFGNLPEANYPGALDAPDLGIPGWTGPEGEGISGGYENQTLRNYVNPAFAGFADDVADFRPSGQYNYNPNYQDPMSITGRPYNDAGWVYQIITLGDMDLAMLADYFGPAPTGTYHPGEITAEFNHSPIVNGPGPDFVTFENGFVLGWTTAEIFGELAYVEVSSNGTDFIRFPTHSLTPLWPGAYGCFIASGVFGMTGKHINAYGDQWGTPFDLAWIADHPLVLNGTVDLNNIRYVRQVDIPGGGPNDTKGKTTGLFFDSYGNPIFDSWVTWGSGGTDLDAIGVLNSSAVDSDGDHIVDYWDNCPQTSNDKQYDTDRDGIGNMCDCDIDGDAGGDGSVNIGDYKVFRAAYGGQGPERVPAAPGENDTYTAPSANWNADADFNGDNTVNAQDYQIFRSRYGLLVPFE